jgi:P4 family phage/plasmid primase-like protien
MKGGDYTTTLEFLAEALRGELTPGAVELVCLPNTHGEAAARAVTTREPDDVVAFLTKHDRAGFGCYFGLATRPAGKTDAKNEDCLSLSLVVADVDFKSCALAPEEVEKALLALPLRPRLWVRSGGGLHLYWLLKEAIDCQTDAPSLERREAVQRLIADVVAGDPIHDVRRVLRLPGTLNSRHGSEVVASWSIDERAPEEVTLEDLEEAFEVQWPLVPRRDRPARQAAPLNVFERIAAAFGRPARVDIEETVTAMSFGGGSVGVHNTQLRVTAALLSRGVPLEDVVAYAVECTASAVPPESKWNWKREERKLTRMCEGWLAKHPELVSVQRVTVEEALKGAAPEAASEPVEKINTGAATGTGGAAVVSLASARAARKPTPPNDNKSPAHVRVGKATLALLQDRGAQLLATEGSWYLYQDGTWRLAAEADELALRVTIREAARALGEHETTKLVNEAARWLTENPDLFQAEVPWDEHRLVVCTNGSVALQGGLEPHAPEHYARSRLALPFAPAAACARWLGFLDSVFAELTPDARVGTINLLQEWFGLGLVRGKPRELRKALILLGPSRTGKTTISEVFAGLFRRADVASPSVADIDDRFGLQLLIGAQAWIRDDAAKEGDRVEATERLKAIITGEPLLVDRKHRPALTCSFEIPILLTLNSLPRIWESSEAVKNRVLTVAMTRVFEEGSSSSLLTEAEAHAGGRISSLLLDQEGPGIVLWAIDGARRALIRRRFSTPENVTALADEMHTASNPVVKFARDCVSLDPGSRIRRADMLAAFEGWTDINEGDDRSVRSQTFWTAFKGRFPRIVTDHPVEGVRHAVGVRLNEEGLAAWRAGKAMRERSGKHTALSVLDVEVNRVVHVPARPPPDPPPDEPRTLAGKARF